MRRVLMMALAGALAACSTTTDLSDPIESTSTVGATQPTPTEPSPSTTGAPPTESVPTTTAPSTEPVPTATTATRESAAEMLERPVVVTSEACPPDVVGAARCGRATVPLDWSSTSSSVTIEVWFAVVPAADAEPTSTFVPLMGGPGDAISVVAGRFEPFVAAQGDAATLFVDVRGTGRSHRLACPAFDEAARRAVGDEQPRVVAACAAQVGPDRNHFTTVASVLDIEAIRRALELPPPRLLGISYGTFVATVYSILFPADVEAVVLDSAFPLDQDPWGAVFPQSFPEVLSRQCERVVGCDPMVEGESIRRLAATLAADPVPLPELGAVLDEGTLANVIQFVLPSEPANLLAAVHAANDGDPSALAAMAQVLLTPLAVAPDGNSLALGPVVSCNDYLAPFDLADDISQRRRDLDEALDALDEDVFVWFSRRGWVASGWEQADSCIEYPQPRIPAGLRVPISGPYPDLPVLVLAGDVDLQTPLRGALTVAGRFPSARILVAEGVGHAVVASSECGRAAVAAFLTEAWADPLTSCPAN